MLPLRESRIEELSLLLTIKKARKMRNVCKSSFRILQAVFNIVLGRRSYLREMVLDAIGVLLSCPRPNCSYSTLISSGLT